MPQSHSEALFKTILKTRFPILKIGNNIRPTAHPNRYNTKGKAEYDRFGIDLDNLEIDAYLWQIRVACEWSGEQHLRPIAHFHAPRIRRTWWQKVRGIRPVVDRTAMLQAFRDQLERDARKAELCAAQGILLMTFDHGDRQGNRLETKLRQIAAHGIATSTDPTIVAGLRAIDWRRPLPQDLLDQWDRLARPGVRSTVRRRGLTRRRKS